MMRNTTVLICDDNIAVHESLTTYLNQTGIDVISLYDGRNLINTLRTRKIDLVILDIMLPGRSGTDICQEIRKTNDIPIIMLSAKSEEDDRILGLELGADDYVTKPFSPKEVTVRVNTILKRLHPRKEPSALFFSNLILYPASYKAVILEQTLDLTPKEFSVLQCLIREPDKVQSRDLILDEVWGNDYFGDTRAVDTIIKRLRAKLSKANAHFTIQSVYGIGYKIDELEDTPL
ncbi:response regulator transcription factor [Ruminococcus sp. 5_1_39BFAA]|uniref:response regulator transcription factor n=1 Tax=Ruminococcus sp. 5_1_39BFAA TaxID=457412 RepID=UPI003562B675